MARTKMNRIALWFVTGMWTGYLRPASGTWGSLPVVVLAVGLATVGADPRRIDMIVGLVGIIFAIACCVWGSEAETHFGKKDPGTVVADEFAGQALALMWMPWSHADLQSNLMMGGVAFLTFRVFDVLKPPPAYGWQRFEGGIGILIDDIVAGLYALASTQLVVHTLL